MEFGLFLQGYVPGPDAHDTDREHEAFMREVELVVAADRTNWKFAWFSEHHALTDDSPHPGHASRAASYTASVCAAMAGQVNRSRIRARPARPMAVARTGSASNARIAPAIARGSFAACSPSTPSRTTSRSGGMSPAITGRPAHQASR